MIDVDQDRPTVTCASHSADASSYGGGHSAWYLGVVPNVAVGGGCSADGGTDGSRSGSPGLGLGLGSTAEHQSCEDTAAGHPHGGPPTREPFKRATEVQLIDRIEAAQLDGRLPISPDESVFGYEIPRVALWLDKYGLKISIADTAEVIDRLPLYSIAQACSYDDGLGHWNVIVKVGQAGKQLYMCYVFQTESENYADNICKNLTDVFRQAIS